MTKAALDPRDYRADLTRDEFVTPIAEAFKDAFTGAVTIDELLVHPRRAIEFCDLVRRDYGFAAVPDDVILRALLQRRKNPSA